MIIEFFIPGVIRFDIRPIEYCIFSRREGIYGKKIGNYSIVLVIAGRQII